jgi:Mce-associated membrane protein
VANPTSRTRGAGSPARRTLTAAARAAAKRTASKRAERVTGATRAPSPEEAAANKTPRRPEEQASGPTLVIEVPDGWDDPPEPSLDSFDEDEPEGKDKEDGDGDGSETGSDAGAGSGSGARRSRGRLLTAILAVLLIVGLIAVAVLGWQYREGQRAEQARGQALTAARKAAPVVLSYDYRHLDRDFASARARLTGKFRDEYGKTTKTVVGPTAKKYEGVVKATVVEPAGGGTPAASVVSASSDKAVVLLFVNQVTRSTQVSGPRVDLNRVRMTLDRTSDGWKVSAVDAL